MKKVSPENSTKLKVSVIVPVYNVEKYLPDCLDSVLNQTLEDLEVICIDDASPDNCGKILDDYAARDDRVRVLHLPQNHQQGYGRNRGLEMAEGKYVYFLDSDDMITTDALEKLYDLSERDSLDAVFFDSQVIYESESLADKDNWYNCGRNGTYEDKIWSGRELYDAFISQSDWVVFVQRQFWRREFLLRNEISSPENTEHEDEFFSFKGILLAERVRYLPAPFFIHRFRANSVMTRPKNAKDFHGYFRNYVLMTELAAQYGLSGETIDRNITHMYEWMVMTYPLFVSSEDPKKWFGSEKELELYNFFGFSQKAELTYARRIRRVLGDVAPYQFIWIYGAGVVGTRVYHALEYLGCTIEGFIVTRKEGNPDTLFGHPVRALDELEPDEGRLALVAVSKRYREEVIRSLEDRGWNYTVYLYGVNR